MHDGNIIHVAQVHMLRIVFAGVVLSEIADRPTANEMMLSFWSTVRFGPCIQPVTRQQETKRPDVKTTLIRMDEGIYRSGPSAPGFASVPTCICCLPFKFFFFPTRFAI